MKWKDHHNQPLISTQLEPKPAPSLSNDEKPGQRG
jgi:hypothetical protein